jgi:hypothetical protein
MADAELAYAVKGVAINFQSDDPDSWDDTSSGILFEALIGGKVYERSSLPHYPSLTTISSVVMVWAESDTCKETESFSRTERLVIQRL